MHFKMIITYDQNLLDEMNVAAQYKQMKKTEWNKHHYAM